MAAYYSDAAVEARLSAIEAKLGIVSGSADDASTTVTAAAPTFRGEDDLPSRIDAAKAMFETKTTLQFRNVWQESEKLLAELDPGAALTYQQQPLLYRRQEVLASASRLQQDMDQLRKMLHLLLTSQPAAAKATPIREEHVTQSPIVASVTISRDDERRLDAVRLSLTDANQRVLALLAEMGTSFECYHAIIAAASEKCVLANEVLHRQSRQDDSVSAHE